jgi:hypothetical protein
MRFAGLTFTITFLIAGAQRAPFTGSPDPIIATTYPGQPHGQQLELPIGASNADPAVTQGIAETAGKIILQFTLLLSRSCCKLKGF